MTYNPTKETLIAARAKIEQGWTQKAFACDETLRPVSGHVSTKATCWCIMGAVMHVIDIDQMPGDYDLVWVPLRDACKDLGNCSIVNYNDAPGRTQAEVLAVFDLAIEKAQ